MAKATALEIVERTKQLVALHRKQAESEISGESVNSMPGAENNKPQAVPPLDPAVKERFPNEPASARSAEGAGPDGTSKLTMKQTLDSTQAAPVSVAKEPLETADANADRPSSKAAGADIASSLVNDIRNHQKKQASTSPKASSPEKRGQDAAEAAKEGEPPAQEAKENAENKEEKGEKEEDKKEEKEGAADYISLDQSVLAKIAAVVLSTKDGWEFAENAIKKFAGTKAAAEVMTHVKTRTEQIDAEQSYQKGAAAAETAVQNMLAEQLNQSHSNAYYQGYAAATKTAGVKAPAPVNVAPLRKAALADYVAGQNAAQNMLTKYAQDQYAQGQRMAEQIIYKYAQDVNAMQDPAMQEAAAQMATDPEAGGEAGGAEGADVMGAMGGDAGGAPPEGGGDAGAGVEEAAGGIGDATPEEIGEALAELVQEGVIPEEQAMQVVEAIDQANGGGEGGAPPEAGVEGAPAM